LHSLPNPGVGTDGDQRREKHKESSYLHLLSRK
jgi:hypothetical protein